MGLEEGEQECGGDNLAAGECTARWWHWLAIADAPPRSRNRGLGTAWVVSQNGAGSEKFEVLESCFGDGECGGEEKEGLKPVSIASPTVSRRLGCKTLAQGFAIVFPNWIMVEAVDDFHPRLLVEG